MNFSSLLALFAGAAIATQATMNAKLGVFLHHSIWGATVAFGVRCIATLVISFAVAPPIPAWHTIQSVPLYLWFSGGVLAAVGVGLLYFLIPKAGVGTVMSYALAGQLLIAVVSSHYGWFDLPTKPINMVRIVGVLALLLGMLLINQD